MDIAALRSELDDTIEALARLPSYQMHRREALAAVSDAIDYIRAATGTLPPQCQVPLDRAFNKALAGETAATIHDLLQALNVLDRITASVAAATSSPAPVRHHHPDDRKPLADSADALLIKLRKKAVPRQ
jgi:hypothetical protein